MSRLAPPGMLGNVWQVKVGFSVEDRAIRATQKNRIAPHFYSPLSRQGSIEFQFFMLASSWKKDTVFISSTTEKCMHPAYLRIIGMSKEALPFILRDLNEEPEPAHWFVALKAITGEDPVSSEHLGYIDRMAEDWILWAKNKGYTW